MARTGSRSRGSVWPTRSAWSASIAPSRSARSPWSRRSPARWARSRSCSPGRSASRRPSSCSWVWPPSPSVSSSPRSFARSRTGTNTPTLPDGCRPPPGSVGRCCPRSASAARSTFSRPAASRSVPRGPCSGCAWSARWPSPCSRGRGRSRWSSSSAIGRASGARRRSPPSTRVGWFSMRWAAAPPSPAVGARRSRSWRCSPPDSR